MLRINRAFCALAVTIASVGAAASEASPIQLLSPSELLLGAVYDFPARTAAGTQPVVPSPFVLSSAGNVLTFTEAGSAFVRVDQEPSVPSGGGWFGSFDAATRLLYTGNVIDPTFFGPLSISFGVPVLDFGVLAQFSDEFATGPFFFTLFSGLTELATFSRNVTSAPSFLGARADGVPFSSVLIRGPSFAPEANDFAIGAVRAQPVPEPATLLLVGSALTGTLLARHRRRARVRLSHLAQPARTSGSYPS